jgi:hypothetical protein
MNEKEKRLNKLTDEYDDLNGKINRLNDFINSIYFEDVVDDVNEQILTTDQYIYMCRYRANLKSRIRNLRGQIQRDREIPPLMMKAEHEPSFDAPRHCGQDADMDDACCQVRSSRVDHTAAPAAVKELPDSISQLVGMQIVSAFRPGWKCEECAFSHIDFARCEKKVELVGGYYLCLAPLPIVTE